MRLSIVIPALNEAENLARLLLALQSQRHINLQIIVVDGGSNDNSESVVRSITASDGNHIEWLTAASGRARQMNAGVQRVTNPIVLFLHADSMISDHDLLASGLTYLNQSRQNSNSIAGHFGLRFNRDSNAYPGAWFFYEAKTYLNRRDCINGDQGMMMSMEFFQRLGGFDESLGYLEDLRLARLISQQGKWITLPGVIETSARRFETEGLGQRQVLNSFIKCFDEIGFHEFFENAGTAYRTQDASARLMVAPFVDLVMKLSARPGARYFCRVWYRIGRYVAANAWQLAFALDCRACEGSPDSVETRYLQFYEKWLSPIMTSPPINLATGIVTLIWTSWIRIFGPRPKTVNR